MEGVIVRQKGGDKREAGNSGMGDDHAKVGNSAGWQGVGRCWENCVHTGMGGGHGIAQSGLLISTPYLLK